jgi:hypothetical protein
VLAAASSLLVFGLLAAGCTPTCAESCRKVLRCDAVQTDRLGQDECVDQCTRQVALYESWEDDDKLAQFREEKRCIATSTCEEVAEGLCYESDIFPY